MAEQNRNLPAQTGTIKTLQALLKQQEKQFAMVLPKTLGIDRFIRITISTVVQNPKLLQCDQKTFLRSLLVLASLGLEPGGPLGLAHLVPFWNSRENRLDCQPIVDYKGYIALAHRSKEVGRITAHIIFEKEPWEFSDGDVIIHRPLPPSERGEKEILVYAKAFDRAGVLIAQEFLWAEEIEKKKAKALENKKNAAANPWVLFEEAMWRKSPVRAMAKWMPMASEMQKAARFEDAQEQGLDIALDVDLQDAIGDAPEPTGVDQKTHAKTQALKEKLQASQQPTFPTGQEMAEKIAVIQSMDLDSSVVDAELIREEEPPPPDEPPIISHVSDLSKQEVEKNLPPGTTPLPSVVVPIKESKSKDATLFGPKDGPKIESGKKVIDYWLDANMVKCPPGGTRETLMTNVKGFCETECKYRRRCFLFKD